MSVRLSVCLSVQSYNVKTVRPNFAKFLCRLPVTVAQSFSKGVAIYYIFPVLRMTSCFHTMEAMGKFKHDVMYRRVRQVALPVER